MRGRTNVMQRTGATVNGNIINAEIAGGPIAIGDFVKWELIQSNELFSEQASHMMNGGADPQKTYHNRFEHMYGNIYMLLMYDVAMLVDVTGGDVEILDTYSSVNLFCKISSTKMLFGGISGGTFKFYLTDISGGRFNALSVADYRIGNIEQQRAFCKLAAHKYINFTNNLSANRLYANIIVLNNDDTEITTIYKVSAAIGYVGDGLYRLSTSSSDARFSERIEEGFYCADNKVAVLTNFGRYGLLNVDSSISGDVNDNTGTLFVINNLTYGLGLSAIPEGTIDGNSSQFSKNVNIRASKNNSGNKGMIAGKWNSSLNYYPMFSVIEYSSNALVERSQAAYTEIVNLFSASGKVPATCSLLQVKDNVFYACYGGSTDSSASSPYYNKMAFVRLEYDPALHSFSRSNIVIIDISQYSLGKDGFGCFAEDTNGNIVFLYLLYDTNSAYTEIWKRKLSYQNGVLSLGSVSSKVMPFSGDTKLAIGFAKTGGAIGDTIQVYTPA